MNITDPEPRLSDQPDMSSRRLPGFGAPEDDKKNLCDLLESKSARLRCLILTTFRASSAGSGRSSRDAVVRIRQARWTVVPAKLESRLVRAHERRAPVNLGAFRSRVYDDT